MRSNDFTWLMVKHVKSILHYIHIHKNDCSVSRILLKISRKLDEIISSLTKTYTSAKKTFCRNYFDHLASV